MIRRLFSLLLCGALLLSLSPPAAAWDGLSGADAPVRAGTAGDVMYLDEYGQEKHTQEQGIQVTEVTADTTAWTNGWYVVNGEVPIASRITVTGDVHLILANDCTLNAENGGINVAEDNSLTIYAQSSGDSAGALVAVGNKYQAGIGGNTKQNSGSITINGGTVNTTGGYMGAGIGGGRNGAGGNIIINSGKVTATTVQFGAGIGSGDQCSIYNNATNITINGGDVTAIGVDSSAGIGGGSSGGGCTIKITGGNVNAQGGVYAAGIGSGRLGSNGIIEISGGVITTTGGIEGAGLGSGTGGKGGTITITGGTVNACGGNKGAGIGSGERGWGGTITITGGTVDATSENSGAGIGGSGTPGTFSTGANGNAFITTSSIADQSSKEDWSGVIFEGNDGAVYGEQTIQTDTEIPAAKTLTIPDGSILTISSGVTLTNNGTIINNGTIKNNGTIINNGIIINYTTIDNNNGTIHVESGGKLGGKPVEGGTVNLPPTPEQYPNLTPGDTYWFDLSKAEIPGTPNAEKPSIPDTTLHWVPFTYVGTVNAYKLTSEQATTEEYATRNKYDHSLFIADYNVTHTVSWNDLNAAGKIFGTDYTSGGIKYILRAPSVGSDNNDKTTPESNEWDTILNKDPSHSGWIKNWEYMFSWGQDTCSSYSDPAIRGHNKVHSWNTNNAKAQSTGTGFRPVLELPAASGLQVVTLNLNGGKTGTTAQSGPINIVVKSGGSFTAPSGEGLTAPSGQAFAGWQSGSMVYKAGETVPSGETALTAYWVSPPSITSQPHQNAEAFIGERVEFIVLASGDPTPTYQWQVSKNSGVNWEDIIGETSSTYTIKSAEIDMNTWQYRCIVTNIGGSVTSDVTTMTVKKPTPTASLFTFTPPADLTYSGTPKAAAVDSNVTGMGAVTLRYFKDGAAVQPVDAGEYTVQADIAEGTSYAAATGLSDPSWSFTITQAGNSITDLTCADIRFGATPQPSAKAAFGTPSYTYSDTPDGSYGPWNPSNAAGIWYVKAAVEETDNYKGAEATASFTVEDAPVTTYLVTVNGGSGSGSYTAGDRVTVTANVPSGKRFTGWTVNQGSVTLANSVTTSFTMPDHDVVITANFEDIPTPPPIVRYRVTVEADGGGTVSGGGTYRRNTTVTITAAAYEGYRFVAWTENGRTVSSSERFTFTILSDRSLVAVFEQEDDPVPPEHVHAWAAEWSGDDTHHWHECLAENCSIIDDSEKDGYAAHVYDDEWDESCDVCGHIRPVTPPEPEHVHAWASAWSTDSSHHWHDCLAEDCEIVNDNEKDGYAAHVYDDEWDESCDVCGHIRPVTPPEPEHVHAWASAWSTDSSHHWHECLTEGCDIISNSEKDGYAAHTPSEWIVDIPASSNAAGRRHRECTVCGWVTETESIPATGGDSRPSGGGSSGGGSNSTTYPPVVEQPSTGGSAAEVSPSNPRPGDTVTITPKPDEGYETDTVTVTSRNGKPVKVTARPNGTYAFTQPSGSVTIAVTYKPTQPIQPVETPWNSPFADVSRGEWYYDAVRFVFERGLMNGYDDGRFGPNDPLTRAQFTQILFNKEGRPAAYYPMAFSDVSGDAWYAGAVLWTASQGIVGGYGDGSFGPHDYITREQLAVMLWRYTGSPAATNKELYFNDESEISGFALEALRWAVENGILTGYGDGQLAPQGQATRGEVAQMLYRLWKG